MVGMAGGGDDAKERRMIYDRNGIPLESFELNGLIYGTVGFVALLVQ